MKFRCWYDQQGLIKRCPLNEILEAKNQAKGITRVWQHEGNRTTVELSVDGGVEMDLDISRYSRRIQNEIINKIKEDGFYSAYHIGELMQEYRDIRLVDTRPVGWETLWLLRAESR